MKFKFRLPKIRNPFANPVDLKKIQRRLFSSGQKKKLNWRTVGKYALWGLGILILIVIILFAWFAKDLPTPGKIRTLSANGSTQLFDRNMKPLYTISGDQRRILVDSSQIPDVARQATIALEDRTFYTNRGISLRGIIRSIFVDVISRQKTQGASTITQQYVRLAILQDTKKSFVRKIKEVILSVEVDALFSKDQILTMYLNEVPYGGNNYGIEAASRAFFSKSAKDLTLPEAATLASVVQAPTTLSPYGPNTDKLLTRRNYDLSTMQTLGFITADQAKQAQAVPLTVSPRHDSIVAPHFVQFVKDWLVSYFTAQLGDAQSAEQKVELGGMKVVTTLDVDKQQAAQDIISKSADTTLKRAGASNAGLVTIDPKRGEIIAMVGSVDYFQPTFGAYNMATAQRQPGSSFKPIVYATAFKDKYSPATTLFDVKTDFGNYTPVNFDGRYHGALTIRQALGNSYNIPAVKTLAYVGLDKALKTATDLGITTLTDKANYGLSLVLGAGDVELVQMAEAYGTFANAGVLMPTTPVLKITDSADKTIYDHTDPKDGQQVLPPEVAYQISNILSDTNAKQPTFAHVMGTLTLKDRPVAVKTGTTSSFRDAWTIGYTPQYVTAVWAGNNDNSPMNQATGAIAASPMWHDFMVSLHQGVPVEQFQPPATIKNVTIDRFSNKLPGPGSDPISDIFAPWQIPTDHDDVHTQVRVCKENGLLADSSVPDALAELRTYVALHSEEPNNPNWEGPVEDWAKANGFWNPPPTQKCQAGSVQPTVHITAPTDGQTVNGSFTISATASAASGVKQVEFLIDNASIGVDTNDPYSTTYDTSLLANGTHQLTAVVTSNSNSTATDQVSFTVNKDTTPPGEITGLNHVFGPTSGVVTFNWINPTDSDFKLVRLRIYTSPGNVLTQTFDINSPGVSITLTGIPGTWNFVFKTVDTSNNESAGVSQILHVP